MEKHETEPATKRRLQKKSAKTIFLPAFLMLIFLLGGYFLFFSDSAQELRPVPTQPAQEAAVLSDQPPSAGISIEKQATDTSADTVEQASPNKPDTLSAQPVSTTEKQLQPEDTGNNVQGASDSSSTLNNPASAPLTEAEKQCNILAENVDQFFTTLDSRDYMQNFNLNQKSSVYFPQLIQKLIDNPPVVSGETDDLFTILQNTAHFFRILGKNNILVLKGILDREKATFEQTLSDFYNLTQYPECLEEKFGIRIGKEPLYYYAGFFINTMGGRLYLFRRDSMSRMVVSNYAILIVDQANREGRNEYGIELSGAVDRLINEIESSSIKLQMRDLYLDSLYSMKEKYQ